MTANCCTDERDQQQIDKEIQKRISALEKREMKYLGIFTGASLTIGAIIGTIWAVFSHKIIAFFK
jgi:VIT1/CCC1 family predicted Fe2+/Mn2+ transporter